MFSCRRACAVAISIGLIAAGFLSAAANGQRHHPTSTKQHKKPKQLGKDLARVKGRKSAAKSELRATKVKAHAVKLDIMTVDDKLVSVKDDLESTKGRLIRAKADRARAGEALKQSTAQLARTKHLVTLRIKHIYMQGPESVFSALSGTHSGGDIASHKSLMGAIEKKDRTVFNTYIALEKRVAAEKRKRDEIVTEVARLEDRQVSQTHVLAETRQEKAELLGNLKQKESDLEASIEQFQVDESRIASQIEAYEREAREAERAAREAQKAGRRSGGSHHSGGGGREFIPLGAFSGRFSRPVNAPITSTFGSRYHPILHRVRMHEGVDFGAGYGTPIHAAADGVVISASYMRGYGHVVILAHGGGFSTVYAHTSHVYCSAGQRIRRGQVIAAVGATGLATGPHLHFEVRINGHAVNPLGHF